MSFPRERIPEEVWRAREAEDAYRAQAEDDYDAHLASKPAPVRKPTMWEQVELENARLEAIVPCGPVDVCGTCGERVAVQDGIYSCCATAWEGET